MSVRVLSSSKDNYLSHGNVVGGVITAVNNLGVLNDSIPYVFAHASDITLPEASILRQFDQHVSITAESEMHYGHGNPHSHLVRLTVFVLSNLSQIYLVSRSKTKRLLGSTRTSHSPLTL